MKIIPVILSGGFGTRLWPLSRKQYPKQYLALAEENTMLQATIQRLQGLQGLADPIIICNIEHRFLVAEQLQQIDIKNPTILLEHIGKNTASAIAAAAHYIDQKQTTENYILVLSADHLIQDTKMFHQAIQTAAKQAIDGKIVTFGITPDEPNTGYGYIEKSSVINNKLSEEYPQVYKTDKFLEKPDQKTANLLLETNNFLWNSGMFLFSTQSYLQELQQYKPKINRASQISVEQGIEDLDFFRLAPFPLNLESLSIDYAVMERTEKGVVVELNAGWDDIGSWNALHKVGKKDGEGNVVKGDATLLETSNSYINADHHMIVTIGIDNLIIVDTPDATLVSNKKKVHQVKQVVEQLQQQKRNEEYTHRKVYRPWGWYDIIDREIDFQIKRISVKSGASLSLQKHQQRAEHWVVIKGTARIVNGDKVELLSENQSTYIPIDTIHRLENPGEDSLEMIEVQSGNYFGEDDIERYEDSYGRE